MNASGLQLSFDIIRLLIGRYAQFWVFRKGSGNSSPRHFLNDFSRNMFFILYSINWPNFIVWLPVILELLDNIFIEIICFPGCDVINFEINLTFLIKLFFYITKKSRHKFKYLQNEKSFSGEIKSIFHLFKRAFSRQNLSQTRECAFKHLFLTFC